MSTLTADGLTLRPWTSSDAPALQQILDDPDIAYRTPIETPFDAPAAQRYLDRVRSDDDHLHWAITTDGRQPLGEIQLSLSTGGIAYLVGSAYRGQGLAKRALRLIAEHAHTALGLPRVILEIEPGNESSAAVGRSAGFRPVGGASETVTDKGRTYELVTWEHTVS